MNVVLTIRCSPSDRRRCYILSHPPARSRIRAGLLVDLMARETCGNFAGTSRARLCSVVTIATGAPWQPMEFRARHGTHAAGARTG